MPRRGEHIHKRKDGRWEARYKCGTSANGKTCYKSVYAKTYTEVKEKLRNCLKSRSKSKYPESSITFGTAADLWLEANKFRHKGATIMRYENLINRHIKPELKDIRLLGLISVFPPPATFLRPLENIPEKRLRNTGTGTSNYSFSEI